MKMKPESQRPAQKELKSFEKELDALFREAVPWWRYYRWKLLRRLYQLGKHIRPRRQNET